MAITTIQGFNKIPTVYRNTALTNSAGQVSSTPSVLTGVNIINPNVGAVVYVKFYDAASATVGTTAIVRTIFCQANTSTYIDASAFGQMYFGTAMSVAVTGSLADADTSGIAVPIHIEVSYQIS